MSKPYVLELTISCDEYIPDFLSGKLANPISYKTFGKALYDAEQYLKNFINWLENDSSGKSKPVYTVKGDTNNAPNNCSWFCDINNGDAWFKVLIRRLRK